jgi:hypothetical protein
VAAYLALLTDRYPATDDQQDVHLHYAYPDAARDLSQWLPLVKWLLAVPHYIVLAILDIAMIGVAIAAWFVIVFTGRYPRTLFDFGEGVIRWHNRVIAYAFTLATDQYPPFRLAPLPALRPLRQLRSRAGQRASAGLVADNRPLVVSQLPGTPGLPGGGYKRGPRAERDSLRA